MFHWDPLYGEIVFRLCVALTVGAFIGLERSYHGRPAGFRTHALVCLSTSLLMLITAHEARWFGMAEHANVRVSIDPTRMAQGIMTGIGFLGAGAIIKEGVTVRGLTTAASIWITAAIGVLIGIGFYFPAALAAVLTLGTLSVFRWIETRIPAQMYANFYVRFSRAGAITEDELRKLLRAHGFTVANLSYRLDSDPTTYFEYRMVIRAGRSGQPRVLSEELNRLPSVIEFRISPMGD